LKSGVFKRIFNTLLKPQTGAGHGLKIDATDPKAHQIASSLKEEAMGQDQSGGPKAI
jgi:hypothetical protein